MFSNLYILQKINQKLWISKIFQYYIYVQYSSKSPPNYQELFSSFSEGIKTEIEFRGQGKNIFVITFVYGIFFHVVPHCFFFLCYYWVWLKIMAIILKKKGFFLITEKFQVIVTILLFGL